MTILFIVYCLLCTFFVVSQSCQELPLCIAMTVLWFGKDRSFSRLILS